MIEVQCIAFVLRRQYMMETGYTLRTLAAALPTKLVQDFKTRGNAIFMSSPVPMLHATI